MNNIRDQYDWAVLGDSPGALLTAGLAARLGLSVLVLPLFPNSRLLVSKSGQYLDPESNFAMGLGGREGGHGLLLECLTRMGILPAEIRRIRNEGALPQVVTPFHRLGFCSDNDEFLAELKREFGEASAETLGWDKALARAEGPICSFWKALPERLTMVDPKTFKSSKPRSIGEVRNGLEKSVRGSSSEKTWLVTSGKASTLHASTGIEGLIQLCCGLHYGMTGVDQTDVRLHELLHVLSLGRTGGSFVGGMTALRDLLLQMARRLGAHVSEKTACRRLFIEDGRLVGVQISNNANVIGVKGAVVGCALAHLREQISCSGRQWFRKLRKTPDVLGWKFTIAVTVRAEAIPPGARPRIIWQEEGAPVLEIEVADPSDYGSSEPGHRWIFLRTLMPFTSESIKAPKMRMVAARMLRQLTEIMPFLEYHIVKIYPDFRDENQEFAEVYGYSSIEAIPDNSRCYSKDGIGSGSGIEGMLVASGESYPALGSFGATVAGLESTAWIAHRCGLVGPLA